MSASQRRFGAGAVLTRFDARVSHHSVVISVAAE